jgi:hypothetical protein
LDETEELVADHSDSDPARSVEESELSAQLARAIEAITPFRAVRWFGCTSRLLG